MPANAQAVADAKKLLDDLLDQKHRNKKKTDLTAADIFVDAVLKALALLETDDFNAFAQIRDELRQAKILMRDLDKAMRPHRPTLHIVPNTPAPDKTAGDYLKDAPLPDLIIPFPYELDDEGTYRLVDDENGVPHRMAIAYAPILITGRMQAIENHAQWLRLSWKRGQHWQHLDVDRGSVMNANELIKLASQGFPVATDNAAHVAHYLHDLEAVNYQTLPTARMTARLGWQGDQGSSGFLVGRTLARRDDIVVIDDLASVAATQWQDHWIVFRGDDDGDEQLIHGFHAKGTLDGWIKAITPAIVYPKVMLAFYAACAAPLLALLHVPNFGIDWNSRTSRGKTTSVRVGASVWGNPDERQVGGAALFPWAMTPVWPERAAAVLNGLPVILDESHLAPKGMASKVLYMVCNGVGKGRGSRRGLAASRRWRTILLSTGENPLASMSEDGGARMRCFSIRGTPFVTNDQTMSTLVDELNGGLQQHYGHVGPLFVQWIQQNLDELDQWKAQYVKLKQEFIQAVTDEASFRLSDYAALLELTARLVHRALADPWTLQQAVPQDLWENIVHEASGAAGDRRALAHVMSWAASHQEAFEGRQRSDRSGDPIVPSGGWAGKWPKGDGQHICWLTHVLHQVLEEGNFHPEGIKELWRENGWLVLEKGRKTYENKETFFGERRRMVVLDLALAERDDDAPAATPVTNGTNGTAMGQQWDSKTVRDYKSLTTTVPLSHHCTRSYTRETYFFAGKKEKIYLSSIDSVILMGQGTNDRKPLRE